MCVKVPVVGCTRPIPWPPLLKLWEWHYRWVFDVITVVVMVMMMDDHYLLI